MAFLHLSKADQEILDSHKLKLPVRATFLMWLLPVNQNQSNLVDVCQYCRTWVFPIKDVLGTNYMPSVTQTSEIKQLVQFATKIHALLPEALEDARTRLQKAEEAHKEVEHLIHDEMIALLQADVLEDMKCEVPGLLSVRVELEKYIREGEALISPARRLPAEVMSNIFEHCLEENDVNHHTGPRPRVSEPPLLLGRICRPWRRIALATPRLWTSLILHLPPELTLWHAPLRAHVEAFEFWLEHSRSRPLQLTIVHDKGHSVQRPVYEVEFRDCSPEYEHLLEIVQSNAHRLSGLSIFMPTVSFDCPAFIALTDQSFPHVKTINIFPTDIMVTPVEPSRRINLDNSPCLRSLGVGLSWYRMTNIHVPWARVTHLHLAHLIPNPVSSTLSDYLQVLRQCKSLKWFSVIITDGIFQTPVGPPIYAILETFEVVVLGSGRLVGGFLNALNLPHLRRLQMQHMFPSGHPQGQQHSACGIEILSLIQRSRCMLWYLILEHVPITIKEMLACCLVCPQLTRLELLPWPPLKPNNEVIEALTPQSLGDTTPILCPRLETLKFGLISPFVSVGLLDLVALRHIRWILSSPLAVLGRVEVVLYKSMFCEDPSDMDSRIYQFKISLQHCLPKGKVEVSWAVSKSFHGLPWLHI
ncbi:hypothetical protein SERLA73DRAFT_158725 [Serpula lacrymans var. lacrymans S7.3]|uniref:Uncharacterized protein n=1 Tax=Serpula lacrymans var. lacrymans (strain S7.3) TaxID=936435 RepID=F8PND3_SERL3|nr:hypothetical protein SERLA73DRAFT_158725 [Serpula lacrymans var. lacrymans S7.3]